MAYIHIEKCNQCEECIFICLNNAIHVVDGKFVIDRSKCKFCNACLRVCKPGAITKKKDDPSSPAGPVNE